MRRTRKLRLRLVVAGTAGLAVVAFVAATSASLRTGPGPDERRVREHAVGRLRTIVEVLGRARGPGGRAGRDAAREPDGVDRLLRLQNDVVSAVDPTQPQMVPTPAQNVEATKTEPDKNTYLVFKNGSTAPTRTTTTARTSCSRATRPRSPSTGEAGLHHAHQPRRRRRAPRDAARDDRTERRRRSPRSTARPGTRSPGGCSSRRRARTRRPTRRPRTIPSTVRTSRAPSAAAATRASRTTPTGNIWLVEDVGGATGRTRPPRARTASSTASSRTTRAT